MQTRRFINQTFTLLMAAMLLMVAGVKSWSDAPEKAFYEVGQTALGNTSQDDASKAPDGNQATVSSLSLNAVITPALSYDFFQDFYFLQSPVWSLEQKVIIVEAAYTETTQLLSYFNRIFGRYIVTNAP